MTVTDIRGTFSPNHVLKHSKQGKKLDSFHHRAYPNKSLCIVYRLKEYLKRRSTKAQTDIQLCLLHMKKPFRAAAIDSMRRWVKDLFIETSILKWYTPHTWKPIECRFCRNFKTGLLEKCQNIL